MDSQLRDLIDDGFEVMAEPPHPPVSIHLHAGQRALRRQRTVTGVAAGLAAAACVAALAVTGVLTPGAGGSAAPDFAEEGRGGSQPAAADRSDRNERAREDAGPQPWAQGEMVRYEDGEPVVRPGTRVLDRVDDWMPGRQVVDSVAVEVEHRGTVYWATAELMRGGSSAGGNTEPSDGWAGFRDWLADQVTVNGGDGSDVFAGSDPAAAVWDDMVRWDGSGTRLAAKHGLSIVAQRGDVDLGPAFAPPGARTAAAHVRGTGVDVFVLVRAVDGRTEQITSRARSGETLDVFLDRAASKYAGGEGLR